MHETANWCFGDYEQEEYLGAAEFDQIRCVLCYQGNAIVSGSTAFPTLDFVDGSQK